MFQGGSPHGLVTGDGGSMGFGAGGAGSAGEYTTIGTILIRPSLASYRMPTRKNPPDILCLTGSCTILAGHGFEYSLSSVPNMARRSAACTLSVLILTTATSQNTPSAMAMMAARYCRHGRRSVR